MREPKKAYILIIKWEPGTKQYLDQILPFRMFELCTLVRMNALCNKIHPKGRVLEAKTRSLGGSVVGTYMGAKLGSIFVCILIGEITSVEL